MKNLELSKGYYEEFGKPVLQNEFADVMPFIAVGFTGRGSEHYGYDDEISKDHDYEPGFCIFLPGEDIVDRRKAFLLERAYAKLPKEYCGVKRQLISPVGGNRNGVIRTADYYASAIGSKDGVLSQEAWLKIPDYALSEAVNGEIWYDGYGEVTAIRERLNSMPDDVFLKRLAGGLIVMAQAGQYNFMRCINHNEHQAAQLACVEFVNAALKVFFMLGGKYMPYYKWRFKALREMPEGDDFSKKLSLLLYGDNSISDTCKLKYTVIEEISAYIIDRLKQRSLTNAVCGDLEKHAYSVNDKISDSNLRNLNIMITV